MSQKKVAAVVRLESLIRGRRTVDRRGKCIVAIGMSVGMLEVLEGVLRIESLYLGLNTSLLRSIATLLDHSF
jgi:hypothetical protein